MDAKAWARALCHNTPTVPANTGLSTGGLLRFPKAVEPLVGDPPRERWSTGPAENANFDLKRA